MYFFEIRTDVLVQFNTSLQDGIYEIVERFTRSRSILCSVLNETRELFDKGISSVRTVNSIHLGTLFSTGTHEHKRFIISYKWHGTCASNIALSSGTNQ